MKIFVKDKFFEDVDSVRELALSLDYSYSASLVVDPAWRGHRTKMPDSHLKENILRFVSQMFQFDAGNYIITSFFHYTNENTKNLIEYKIRKCCSNVQGNFKKKYGFTPFVATCEHPTLEEK